jgi:hypothetical protein
VRIPQAAINAYLEGARIRRPLPAKAAKPAKKKSSPAFGFKYL